MKKWLLFCFLVVSLQGCKKDKSTLHKKDSAKSVVQTSLLKWIPQDTDFLAVVHQNQDIPNQLTALLQGLHGLPLGKEMEKYVVGNGKALMGLNPLNKAEFLSKGFLHDGSMVIAKSKLGKEEIGIIAIELKYPEVFEKHLQSTMNSRDENVRFKKSVYKGISLVEAHRGKTDGMVEFIYILTGKELVLISLLSDPTLPSKTEPTPTQKVQAKSKTQELAIALLQLKDSLLGNAIFADAWKKMAHDNHISLFRRSKKADAPKFQLTNKMSRQQLLQFSQIALNQSDWMTVNLKVEKKGISINGYFALPERYSQALGSLLPQQRENLNFLHQFLPSKRLISAQAQLSLEGIKKLLKRFGLNAQKAQKELMTFTGVSLDDLLATSSGKIAFSLEELDSSFWKRLSIATHLAPRSMTYMLAASIQDSQKLGQYLLKIKDTLKINNQAVERMVHNNLSIDSITAWPQTKACWSLKSNVFLYSLGKNCDPLKQMLDKHAQKMTENNDEIMLGAIHLHAVKETLAKMNMNVMAKMFVLNFLGFLDGLSALKMSALPDKKGINLSLDLTLQPAKK